MNWRKIIAELNDSGMTQAEIAEHIGRSQIWVSDAYRRPGRDLKWRDGDRLLALHRARCGDEAAHDERVRRDHELQEVA